MTELSDLAGVVADIAENAGNNFDAMSQDELSTVAYALIAACAASGGLLVHRCGGDPERARVQLSRAQELPPSVLRRRAKEAEGIVNRNEVPNIPQHAAHVALMLAEIQVIGARLQRRQMSAAIN